MHSHTTEGLMQLVSEFGQCRWSEGTYGASFIAKGQERGQREEAAKLYEEIRSYAAALCQQVEPLTEHRAMRVVINACDSLNITRFHSAGKTWTICDEAGLLEIVRAIEAAHGISAPTSKGKTE